jgi:hypothetical protein
MLLKEAMCFQGSWVRIEYGDLYSQCLAVPTGVYIAIFPDGGSQFFKEDKANKVDLTFCLINVTLRHEEAWGEW